VHDVQGSTLPSLDSRRLLRAFDWGALAMLGSALAYGLLMDPIGLSWGLIAVAIGAGWLIGKAVLRGAWGVRLGEPVGTRGRPSRLLQLMALGLSLVAWLLAFAVGYLASQSLAGAAPVPFETYVTSIYGPHQLAALAAFVVMGWWSARWTLAPDRQAR
jgi:hypothetical protein